MHTRRTQWPWFGAAFLLPIVIMASYFAARGVFPFGNQSILTVDLGQQYIDFYSYFRQTILGHPDQFLYSFNKALGGDMLGVWTYYLMSPFNLVLVLFPKGMLDSGIVVLTLLKYGAASLTMAIYLRHHHVQKWWLLLFGLAYALSGWMLANQLNIMWLDGAILLPLVALGIDRLPNRFPGQYMLWLTVALIVNYYMGYMICLFVIGYFFYASVRDWQSWRAFVRRGVKFVGASLVAAGISAWLLLPTFFQLTQSKGTYTVKTIHWQLEYAPAKIFGKLITGSFNFDQMPSGQPNIFVGSVVLLLALVYFLAKRIRWQEKLAAGLWSAFLIFSMMFEPLDLLWHGMQFPVWYPYRFSFVVTFWLILLAARGLQFLPDGLSTVQMLVLLVATVSLGLYVGLNLDNFSYLDTPQLIITLSFMGLTLIMLTLYNAQSHLGPRLFALVGMIELATNAVLTLNQLSYVSHSDYHTYTESLRQAVNELPNDSSFYRVGKTVLRTKNDAMQIGYNGTDQFNSMFEPAVPAFYGEIGQPAGDGFVAYTDGTLITDALLDLKYFIDRTPQLQSGLSGAFLPSVSARPDFNDYERIGKTSNLALYENPYALGIGFMASANILKTNLFADAPLANQEQILADLTGRAYQPLFSRVTTTTSTKGVKKQTNGTTITYTKDPLTKTASITLHFTATTSDPYYLTIGRAFTDNAASITLNGQAVPVYDTFRDTVALNVTPSALNKSQSLTITLNNSSLDFRDVALYRLDRAQTVSDLNSLRQQPLKVTQTNSRSLTGTVTVAKSHQVLMTTIPAAPGWHVTVDGKPHNTKTALGLFQTIALTPGKHVIHFSYWPPYLNLGLMISVTSLTITGLWWLFSPKPGRHFKRHKR
ncbi:YfhO family protein [Lacticaseibacillus brantae]|uniref:Integral membrane protein n=1 Tax=Lacticaseibacillus brantae DSM 23927 TaxID=1423727 RepID=A0A0R2B8L7_9LACO|nr:YfhO family protein [Lacticaseibacillus brantae]KRM72843.1 hypothetical protein FC34_GL000555 [Lacticaseibacillus brantae DSM 23927]